MLQHKMPLRRFLHYYLCLLIKGQVAVSELNNAELTLSPLGECGGDVLDAGRSQVKSIIKLFHLDVILIYTALLLKRKIAIYHHSQSTLLDFMAALPAFLSHRAQCTTEALYPNVDLHPIEQIEHLRGKTGGTAKGVT